MAVIKKMKKYPFGRKKVPEVETAPDSILHLDEEKEGKSLLAKVCSVLCSWRRRDKQAGSKVPKGHSSSGGSGGDGGHRSLTMSEPDLEDDAAFVRAPPRFISPPRSHSPFGERAATPVGPEAPLAPRAISSLRREVKAEEDEGVVKVRGR